MSVQAAIDALRDAIDRLAERAGYALGAMQSAIYELEEKP